MSLKLNQKSENDDKEDIPVVLSEDFNKINDINKPPKILLSKRKIWILMILISLNHAFLYISPGILSSCITQIKFELKLSDEAYGMFGTINGFGALIGSIIFTLIIERANHKKLIISVLLLNCFCHVAFYLKLSYTALIYSRFISGFATIFCFTYFPQWVDKFGILHWVNFMQTFVQISKTIGNVLGYFIYFILGSKKWNYGFLIESILVTIVVFFMKMIPKDYYDKHYIDPERELENKLNHNSYNGIMTEERETVMKDILCNVPYILLCFYKSNRFFIYVAIQFWFSNYLQTTLLVQERHVIFFSYSITMILASFIGNIFGGIILNLIGGPNSKHSFIAMLILQLISVIFGILSNKINSVYYFNAMMSLYNFFNFASGMISISSSFAIMPKTIKGTANGIFSVVLNLTAFLPAPYAYASIKRIVGDGKYVINVLMYYGCFGCVELIIADLYMRIKKVKLYKEEFRVVTLKDEKI
jgi:predicted MFS family arabinose efflux permease